MRALHEIQQKHAVPRSARFIPETLARCLLSRLPMVEEYVEQSGICPNWFGAESHIPIEETFAKDKILWMIGGERRFRISDGFEVIRVGGASLSAFAEDVFQMYEGAYREFGLQYFHARDLLEDNLAFDLITNSTGDILAFVVWRMTDFGYKTVASGSIRSPDGRKAHPEGKKAWIASHRRLKSRGYYSELSEQLAYFADKEQVPSIPVAIAARILPHELTLVSEFIYQRDIFVNGQPEKKTKQMKGSLWTNMNVRETAE